MEGKFLFSQLLVLTAVYIGAANTKCLDNDAAVATSGSGGEFKVSSDIFNQVSFIPHRGGAWQNYLTMNVRFPPVVNLFAQLLVRLRKTLTNRGEAHVTVITPKEYMDVMQEKKVTMDEIDAIAKASAIQHSKFEPLCLGRGVAVLNNKTEETYFVVVRSANLVSIREKVVNLFVSKGGDRESISSYYPHITVGYTKRDLFEQDGVIKDLKSCWAKIIVVNDEQGPHVELALV